MVLKNYYVEGRVPRKSNNVYHIMCRCSVKKTLEDSSGLVTLESEYRRNLWDKMDGTIQGLLQKSTVKEMWQGHSSNLAKIRRFFDGDLKKYYEKLGS